MHAWIKCHMPSRKLSNQWTLKCMERKCRVSAYNRCVIALKNITHQYLWNIAFFTLFFLRIHFIFRLRLCAQTCINKETITYLWALLTFSVRGQIENIFIFAGHIVSMITTQFWCCSVNITTDNSYVDGDGIVPIHFTCGHWNLNFIEFLCVRKDSSFVLKKVI